ncbi:CsiV family protein [Candidiatus Paracoxiella cheracis]|uniref:CsiV family protein n=1 Tax=Candidiatus Paracoxiella cheracis TaxID=3405120 RepID=UPI003BF612E3
MKRSIFTVIIATALSSLLLTSLPANADIAKAYQVELIVFSHMSTKSLDTEQWPLSTGDANQYLKGIRLAPVTSNLRYYRLLAPQDFTLAKQQARLNKYISTYHTIMHIAWRQQVFEPRYARTVHILGGETYNNAGTTTSQVHGTIRVSVERYLNVNLNLTFAAPASAISKLARNDYFNNMSNNLVYFNLRQTRRMRSDELNYIDFPLYGVLIKITPIQQT